MASEKPEISALQILEDIRSGKEDPKLFDREKRLACGAWLKGQGYSTAHIAQILKMSDRQARRDFEIIRARMVLAFDEKFIKEMVSEFVHELYDHHGSMKRHARGKDLSNQEKIVAEAQAWKILNEGIARLQALGVLPAQNSQVGPGLGLDGNAGEATPEKMREMLVEYENAAQAAGSLDKETQAKIVEFNKRIDALAIVRDIKKLEGESLKEKETENE
ncbi:MAG TPA: hypothetical protein PLO78_08780 [Candidatus Omnitrophota bacterium]|nr:hypothetical protein [Candidatus Omnitrophota bacterium]